MSFFDKLLKKEREKQFGSGSYSGRQGMHLFTGKRESDFSGKG